MVLWQVQIQSKYKYKVNTNTILTWEGAGVTLVLQLVKGEETFL